MDQAWWRTVEKVFSPEIHKDRSLEITYMNQIERRLQTYRFMVDER